MTWFAQVRHVLTKDIREAGWPLGIYVALVLLASAQAMEWLTSSVEILQVLALLVVLFGMVLAASIVQSDSPIRADAFWATRPLHASAVLVAKLSLGVIVIVGPPLVGQWGGLSEHGITGRTLAAMLGDSAAIYAQWLLMAMVVGAVTPDIRTFIVALLAIPTGMILFVSLTASARVTTTRPARFCARI